MHAVVLDFDGVVVRSMEQQADSYRRTLAPLGIEVTDEQVFEREGARSESIVADFLDEAADGQRVKELADEKQRTYLGLGRPPCYDGAKDMVRGMREAAGALGLVTGTRRENLELLIPDLLPLFDAVLAQDDYEADKPDPEPYAEAARRLGVAPADCVALENAPRGVQSAVRAGYGRVIGITTTMPRHRLLEAGAHEVVGDHGAALDAVRRALGRA